MTPDAAPQPNGRPKPDDPFAPFNPEDYGFPPPLTKARGMGRRREDLALREKYPGRYVAYTDTWTGDVLDRTVLFTAQDVGEFHKLLKGLAPELLRRVETRFLRDPEEGIFLPSITLDDASEPG